MAFNCPFVCQTITRQFDIRWTVVLGQACPQLFIQTTIRGVLSYLLSLRAALDLAVNCELYTLGVLTAHIDISTPDAICSLIVYDKLATSCWTENLRDPSQGNPKSARSTYDHLIPDTTTTRFCNLSASGTNSSTRLYDVPLICQILVIPRENPMTAVKTTFGWLAHLAAVFQDDLSRARIAVTKCS